MKLFFNAGTGGFYDSEISGNDVPPGSVEITSEERVSLLSGLREGRLLKVDEAGRPVLGNLPVPAYRDISKGERNWRDQSMLAPIGLRDRHRDQLEMRVVTTLSAEQFSELLIYIQALRDWPQSEAFPSRDARPVAPIWISSLDFQA